MREDNFTDQLLAFINYQYISELSNDPCYTYINTDLPAYSIEVNTQTRTAIKLKTTEDNKLQIEQLTEEERETLDYAGLTYNTLRGFTHINLILDLTYLLGIDYDSSISKDTVYILKWKEHNPSIPYNARYLTLNKAQAETIRPYIGMNNISIILNYRGFSDYAILKPLDALLVAHDRLELLVVLV